MSRVKQLQRTYSELGVKITSIRTKIYELQNELRSLVRNQEDVMSEIVAIDQGKLDAEGIPVMQVDDPKKMPWRRASLMVLDIGLINGIGKYKRQSLIEMCPTVGDLHDKINLARFAKRPLASFLPRGIGDTAAAKLEEVAMAWISQQEALILSVDTRTNEERDTDQTLAKLPEPLAPTLPLSPQDEEAVSEFFGGDDDFNIQSEETPPSIAVEAPPASVSSRPPTQSFSLDLGIGR